MSNKEDRGPGIELYRGFDILQQEDYWIWKNPWINPPLDNMWKANTKQDIKTIIDFLHVYYGDIVLEEVA